MENAEALSDQQQTLAQLRWQCRRGMLELDLFLQKFVRHGYHALDEQQRQHFIEILAFPDQELLEILLGQVSATEQHINDIADRIRQCAAL